MKGQKELFEFLCQLIDIQIKKYVSLATVGVGPDARLNAKLVCDEVSELLEFAELITDTKRTLHEEYPELLHVLFNQVKFYVEQETCKSLCGMVT